MILFHDFSVWYLTDDINKYNILIFWTELRKAGSNQQVSALQYLILNHYEPLREDKNAGRSIEKKTPFTEKQNLGTAMKHRVTSKLCFLCF